MKYEEIIKLLDSGFSRDEILAMEENPNDEGDENSGSHEEEAENRNDETGISEIVNDLKNAITEMRKEFTAFNIMNSRQPEEKTPEDIIANIINPTRTKKKGE